MSIHPLLMLLLLALIGPGAACAEAAAPPRLISDGPKTRPVQLPDGSLRAFFARSGKLLSVSSTDGGRTWSQPKTEWAHPQLDLGGGLPMLDSHGEIHIILTHARGSGPPAVTRFIDLWHCRTFDERRRWGEPQRIWEGYCGAVMDVQQLTSGRIVVPFAAWKTPGEPVAPATGSNYTTVVTSDDGGNTWQLAPVKLTSPCDPDYNGNNYGAIEPTILELQDGRVWMLMRTQTGFLYESFSEDGVHWSPAKPSRFHSSTSPAALVRLPDRRIVVIWNNCEQPPRHDGAGVYGGRDALHAAISADEGTTWRGFREIYRDPYRNDTPPKRGDRGTAYPATAATKDGKVVVATGQGNRRTLLILDPKWLLQARQVETFDGDLSAWHVWLPFGPARGYWRDRTPGPQRIDHPTKKGKNVLHVRRTDQRDADCATWNFPAGETGKLTLRVLPRPEGHGFSVALNNRFFNPLDSRGETESPIHAVFSTKGDSSDALDLSADEWHTVEFEWDLSQNGRNECLVRIDDRVARRLKVKAAPFGGISYLRIWSAAQEVDPAGVLIESVRVEVEVPVEQAQP